MVVRQSFSFCVTAKEPHSSFFVPSEDLRVSMGVSNSTTTQVDWLSGACALTRVLVHAMRIVQIDQVVGATLMAASVTIFTYYTVWTILLVRAFLPALTSWSFLLGLYDDAAPHSLLPLSSLPTVLCASGSPSWTRSRPFTPTSRQEYTPSLSPRCC